MRIAHAVRSDGFAGVERHIQQLARAEDEAGHEVTVIGGDPPRMQAGLPDSVRHLPATTVLGVTRALRQAGDVEVVNLHMTAAEVGAALGGFLTRRSGGPRYVVTRHFAGVRGGSAPVRLAGRYLRHRVAAQIAVSHYVADRIDGDSTVVHSGVAPRPDGLPAAEREQSVLLLQRLEPEKGADIAIAAFASSGLIDHGWRLDIAGEGALRTDLEALTHRLGIAAHVRFLGHVADAPQRLATAGVLMAPCAIEGLGLTVLEGMAAGTPVLAAAAGGHLETIGSVPVARLLAPDDVPSAALALQDLAHDPVHRDRVGRASALRQREAFSIESQQRGTEAVYRSVL
ncbi:glycosyltransferase family 4 protein [Kribbia dieselivorans]|uniref:glycosyltransferase family 4 protein n=1 Tax=Kribbia dieselivorans TaxID=331526 RepID=UPI000838F43E|nr:glycosyltransferase family 4 protein [Kribbia dieselivorans]